MTCDELLERLVDPASAGQGGHAPVVEHLNSCAKCRGATKAFGAIERLYKPESAAEPPRDFDNRVLGGLAEAEIRHATRRRIPIVAVAVGLGILIIAAAAFFWLRPSATKSASMAAAKATPVTTPTDISKRDAAVLAGIEGPELTPEETERVKRMHDFAFLRAVETLAGLDAFFPDDLVVHNFFGPVAPAPSPAAVTRPPETVEHQADRLYEFRRLPKAEKSRLEALDDAFRARPADQRVILLRRWDALKGFTEEDFAGLRRLASRFAELDVKRREKLKADIRAISASPPDKRVARWQALPFSKGLTGQENTVAEHLVSM